MWLISFRVNMAIQMVFLTLWPTYALLGLGKALDSNLLFHIGGAFGIATAARAGTRRSPSPRTARPSATGCRSATCAASSGTPATAP
jgi:hypothetical protein